MAENPFFLFLQMKYSPRDEMNSLIMRNRGHMKINVTYLQITKCMLKSQITA